MAPPDSAFGARVRAEIESMGFTVDPVPGLQYDATSTALAAARVIESPPPRRIELWIKEPHRARLRLRTVIEASSEDDEATETVRASEQLRAFFQPLLTPMVRWWRSAGSETAVAAAASPPPASNETAVPQRAPTRVVASAAMAVPFQPGGPGLDIEIRLRWMPIRWLGVGALVSIPVLGSRVVASGASASVAAPIFGAEVTAVLLDARPVRLAASAGLGVAWLRATGTAMPPLEGRTDSVVTAMPLLGAEVGPRITYRIRILVAAHVGISLPRADVTFASKAVATWGRPLGLVSIGPSFEY